MKVSKDSVLLEEKCNTYSHAIGILLGFIGFVVLFAKTQGSQFFIGTLIYSFTVIILFSASTLYHAVTNPQLKKKLRIFDHISIYYLIAGTYTPVCLYLLDGSKGELLLYLVWGIAFIGTFLKLFFTGKFEIVSLFLYGVMGWLVVIDIDHLMRVVSDKSLLLLALGGFFYTAGILFYALKRIPYNHLIWHFFVLGGAISHWYLIYNELLSRI